MELAYKKLGAGPNLIILHGLYGSGDNWFNIAKALAENYTVYLVDQRNHGDSPHSALHNYEEMSKDLYELVNKAKLDPVFLIGHSMGGKTAMTFTLQNPGMVKKLINVDISPFSYLEASYFKPQQEFHEGIVERFINAPINESSSRKEIDSFFAERISDISIRRFLLKNLTRDKESRFFWKINTEAISQNLENVIDAAPPIKMGAQSFVETLFIRGGKSPYITDEDVDGIKDIFSNSTFVTYPNAGHWLHAEEPEKFISDVKDFFS